MKLAPIFAQVDSAVEAQLRLSDPAVSEVASSFLDAFRPALRNAFLEIAQHAAEEISAQLGDRRVDIRLVDGDPELVVTADPSAMADTTQHETSDHDDLEARITLRLPGSLKGSIENAASDSGASINSWVVEALRSWARRAMKGSSVEETFDL